MKKILTINCTSDNGSIPKIISDIEKENPEYEYFHCYQIGERSDDVHEYLVDSWNMTRVYYALARIRGIKYGLGNKPTARLINHIEEVAPDLVHIHCPNFYSINLYKLFQWLKEIRMPVLITNHAEFYYTGNCAYALECIDFMNGCRHCGKQFDSVHPYMINRTHYEWKKMKESFLGANNFVMTVVSPWQEERIRLSPLIPKGMPIKVILNGVDTETFRIIYEEKNKLRSKLGFRKVKEPKGFVALQVTSYFSDDPQNFKGGIYLIEMARMLPDIEFVVVGNYNLSGGANLPKNLTLVGNISDQKTLAMYYNAADITVLTSTKETFGMACAESLCCGTPVVAFKAGGTESIALKEYSEFTEYGDVEALANILRTHKDSMSGSHNVRFSFCDDISEYRSRMSNEATDTYDRRRMGREYGYLYENLLS